MRGFENLKLSTKLAIPVLLLLAVMLGVVLLARAGLHELSATTVNLVDVQAARNAAALTLKAAVNDVTIQEKSLILAEQGADTANFTAHHKGSQGTAADAADTLIALSDTPERRAANEHLKKTVMEAFDKSNQAVSLSVDNKKDAAVKLSVGEGQEARLAAIDAINEQVETVQNELDAAKQAAAALADRTTTKLGVVAGLGLLIASGLLGAIVVIFVSRPLAVMAKSMEALSAGDLEVQVKGAERKDELGVLARSLQVFKENAIERKRLAAEQLAEQERKDQRNAHFEKLTREFDSAIRQLVGKLSGAASDLETTAQSMTATAEQASNQALAVSTAADQASANVATVAAASEELTSSIEEIGRRVAHSSEIAGRAAEDAKRTDQTVRRLAEGAQKIEEVVTLIQTIAGQTNLLALNATIEAARAGEAGKGFAVVASEVKSLATQTAKATEEISGQVANIQGATQEAVRAIEGIGATIVEINEIAAAIAAAVEQQGAATQEIARNVQQAASGTQEVSGEILGVKEAAGETGDAASQVLHAAKGLSTQAEQLATEVNGFLAQARAA